MSHPNVREAEIEAIRRNLQALKREFADVRFLLHQRKYRPDQARVPAGNPDGGQWTDEPSVGLIEQSPRSRRSSTSEKPTRIIVAARRTSQAREAICNTQYQQDIFHCKLVGLPACYGQAALRYANCPAGLPIPPLNY
ncbi:MAG: hypothetical protein HC900_01525 [Methylacidiphilales bacterium]|nr:hypothetical protein [Candidatus Methylacidiphilales bacterium]